MSASNSTSSPSSSAMIDFFLEGNRRSVQGDLEGAAYCFEACIRQEGGETEVSCYANLGDVSMKLGDIQRAEEIYARCVEILPGEAVCFEGQGRVQLAKQFDSVSAVTAFEKCLNISPESSRCAEGLGIAQSLLGANEAAERAFATCARLDSRNDVCQENLGKSAYQRGELETAMNRLQLCVNANPDSHSCYSLLSSVFSKKFHDDYAVRYAQKATKIFPNNPVYHSQLGYALNDNNKKLEALESFLESIILSPEQQNLYEIVADNLREYGEIDTAIFYYDQCAQRQGPSTQRCHHELGREFLKQGKLEEATRQLKESIQLKPRQFEAYSLIASAWKNQFLIASNQFIQETKASYNNLVNQYF